MITWRTASAIEVKLLARGQLSLIALDGSLKSINRDREAKALTLTGIKGYADVGVMPNGGVLRQSPSKPLPAAAEVRTSLSQLRL
jgi:hypothetical protein